MNPPREPTAWDTPSMEELTVVRAKIQTPPKFVYAGPLIFQFDPLEEYDPLTPLGQASNRLAQHLRSEGRTLEMALRYQASFNVSPGQEFGRQEMRDACTHAILQRYPNLREPSKDYNVAQIYDDLGQVLENATQLRMLSDNSWVLTQSGETYVLVDNGSMLGTWVNYFAKVGEECPRDKPIKGVHDVRKKNIGRVPISDGDIVTIGLDGHGEEHYGRCGRIFSFMFTVE